MITGTAFTDCPLPTADCPLPTADCPLRTADFVIIDSLAQSYLRKNTNHKMNRAPKTMSQLDGSISWMVDPTESTSSVNRDELPPVNAPYSPNPCAINMSDPLVRLSAASAVGRQLPTAD